MCEVTQLEDTPWVGVRWKWKGSDKWFYFDPLTGHPNLNKFNINQDVDFAVAVLEGKPVFVGDRIYAKRPNSGMCGGGIIIIDDDGIRIEFENKTSFHIDIFRNAPIDQYFTCEPPIQKRTFEINGVELPCPNKNGIGHGFSIDDTFFAFDTLDDAVIVSESFLNILTEARDK
jgi:hypothetical protein